MAAPKSKTSKSKSKMRRGANRWSAPSLQSCPECGQAVPGHIACPHCGFYRGRQVVQPKSL